MRKSRMQRERARRRQKARIRRHRLIALTLCGAVTFALWSIVGALTSASGRATTRSLTLVRWREVVGPSTVVAGRLGAFAWPKVGEAAVGIAGAGVIASSPRQRVVPIASMTKMMTAIIILRDHPLAIGEQGPVVTITAQQQRAWVTDSQNGDSVVPVRAQERLSEYQLLEGLLMSSGDNIADVLAVWDAHSIGAFVTKMNLHARALHLSHTVYADASGVSPSSRSTPGEQIPVASQLMTYPVARLIVAQKSIPFPVAGSIPNYNPDLGVDGIIGVKSGFTHAAMGCLAVAAIRSVHGHQVMMIAVATGNTSGLYGAGRVDTQLLAEAARDLVAVTPMRGHATLSNVVLPGSTTSIVLRPIRRRESFIAWRGAHISSALFLSPSAAIGRVGASARLVYHTRTGTLGVVPLTVAPLTSSPSGSNS